jgi:hypothetical protein
MGDAVKTGRFGWVYIGIDNRCANIRVSISRSPIDQIGGCFNDISAILMQRVTRHTLAFANRNACAFIASSFSA